MMKLKTVKGGAVSVTGLRPKLLLALIVEPDHIHVEFQPRRPKS